MSDFDIVESPTGSYSTQDADIDKLALTTAGGDTIDLKKLMIELSYFEDLYSFSTSGYVMVRDSLGLIEKMQITGKEQMEISFGKMRNGQNNVTKSFRVYKIGDRKPNGNLSSETYKLYFCSEELILSEQIKVSKSYTGWKISDIVADILFHKLKTPNNKIQTVESTVGVYDFVVPLLKPFEAISWLSIYARPENTNLVGADMLLFETKNGYNFRSLASMMAEDPYTTYMYQQNNLSNSIQNFDDKTRSVLKFEVIKSFDALNDASSGTFANRTITIDPLTKTYNVTDFDYDIYKNQIKPMNGSGILPSSTNRFGLKPNQSYEGSLKVLWGNSNESSVSYIKDRAGSVAKDIFAETYVRYRTAQLSLANHTVLKLVIPGDPGLTVGRTINFNVFSLTGGTEKTLDKFYSGKYLVTAVRHVLQSQGIYQTIVEIAKESSMAAYQATTTLKN
jgi:hypothetical protein